jgi:hypothetical protein
MLQKVFHTCTIGLQTVLITLIDALIPFLYLSVVLPSHLFPTKHFVTSCLSFILPLKHQIMYALNVQIFVSKIQRPFLTQVSWLPARWLWQSQQDWVELVWSVGWSLTTSTHMTIETSERRPLCSALERQGQTNKTTNVQIFHDNKVQICVPVCSLHSVSKLHGMETESVVYGF